MLKSASRTLLWATVVLATYFGSWLEAAPPANEQEAAEALQMLRDLRLTLITEEQRCTQAFLSGPTRSEMQASQRREAQAESRAEAAAERFSRARGFYESLGSSIVAYQALVDLDEARDAAGGVEERRQGAHLGSRCASTYGAARRELDRRIAQGMGTSQERAEFAVWVGEQRNAYRDHVRNDSRMLLQRAEQILPKINSAQRYSDISEEASGFLRAADNFEDRYLPDVANKKFQDVLDPPMAAIATLRGVFTNWRSEEDRAEREASATAEVEKARREYKERPSETRRMAIWVAEHNRAQNIKERQGFAQDRARYMADTRKSLDAAWAVAGTPPQGEP